MVAQWVALPPYSYRVPILIFMCSLGLLVLVKFAGSLHLSNTFNYWMSYDELH